MSLNNSTNCSNNPLNSIGIPSIFFKNKSILNFNQFSTFPKIKCLLVPNNLFENKNLSLYNEKMKYRIKRTVLTNPNYTEEQKIRGFRIIESNKRKINNNSNNIIKKLCIERNVCFSPNNSNKIDSTSQDLLIPKSKIVKHSTSSNCIDSVYKEFNLRDKSFLQNTQLFEESSIDKTTSCSIDNDDKNESILQDHNLEMIIDNSRSQQNENKIIHLNLLDATQPCKNNYKAKSIFELLTQIDNHRLSCYKKQVSGCLTYEKRFENIKALLSSDTNRSENKSFFSLSDSNHISKYSSQLNNSNSNSVVLNKLPKVEILEYKEDLNKNCQNDIFAKKVKDNLTIEKNKFKPTTLIEDSSIPKKVSNEHNIIIANENDESKLIHLNYYNTNNASQSKESALSLSNEKIFKNLESKSSINNNLSPGSNKCDNGINKGHQLKCISFVSSFDKTYSDNESKSDSQVIVSNNMSEFITTISSTKTDSGKIAAFSPMSNYLKLPVISNDSTVMSNSLSFGIGKSTTPPVLAPISSNVFYFSDVSNSLTISKSSIFNSNGSLSCSSSDNFSGKDHSNNILFGKTTSSNNPQSMSSQSLAMSISSAVSINGLFSQSVLLPGTSTHIDTNKTRSEFSLPKIAYSPPVNENFKNVTSEIAVSSSVSKMTENKTNMFINKSNESNIENSILKTETKSTSYNMFSFGVNVISNSFSSKLLTNATSSTVSNGHKDDKSSLFSFGQRDSANFLPFTSISASNTILTADHLTNNSQQLNSNNSGNYQTNPIRYLANHKERDIDNPKSTSNNFVFGLSFNEIKPISNNKEFAIKSNDSSGYLNNTCQPTSFLQNPFNFGNTKNVDTNSNTNPFAFRK